MTLDEASEILAKERRDHHSFNTDIIGQAEQLGIEALKRIKEGRKYVQVRWNDKLPGETED